MAQNRIIKIGIVGAESTGKTWLCENLARHYDTVWVPEYAREYFNDSDIYNYTLSDLEQIAIVQLEMEEAGLLKANGFLFCDTTLITLKIWAQLEFSTVPPVIKNNLPGNAYDYYLITNNDVPWQKDEQRQNKFSRDLLLELNVNEVKKSNTPFYLVEGSNNTRLANAINCLNKLL